MVVHQVALVVAGAGHHVLPAAQRERAAVGGLGAVAVHRVQSRVVGPQQAGGGVAVWEQVGLVVGYPVVGPQVGAVDFEGQLVGHQHLGVARAGFGVDGFRRAAPPNRSHAGVVEVVEARLLAHAQAFETERVFGLEICQAIDGIQPIQRGGGAGHDFHAVDVQITRPEHIPNGPADVRRLVVYAVHELGEAHVGGVGEAAGVDDLEAQAGGHHLHALQVLDGVEKRRRRREPQRARVELFHRHRRLQKAFFHAGSRHHHFAQGHVAAGSIGRGGGLGRRGNGKARAQPRQQAAETEAGAPTGGV